MPAPIEILDSIESIFDIYFSGVRHRERAAFILCDNLVEMVCKTKAVQHNHTFNTNCNFHQACSAPGVLLASTPLGARVRAYRNTRNNMQHASAAATVDAQHCATAMLDAVEVIDHCWPGTSGSQFPLRLQCALRISRLYSSRGDTAQREPFEDKMRDKSWRTTTSRERVRANARQIEIGRREYWWYAIRMQTSLVEECLNELSIP